MDKSVRSAILKGHVTQNMDDLELFTEIILLTVHLEAGLHCQRQ